MHQKINLRKWSKKTNLLKMKDQFGLELDY